MPTLADVARLTRDSDYTAFMSRGVDETVKRAALKKLFSDPQFNVMDGLDVYIDDYGRPDPLPLAALRKMTTTAALGLPRESDAGPAPAAPAAQASIAPPPDEPGTAAQPAAVTRDAAVEASPAPIADAGVARAETPAHDRRTASPVPPQDPAASAATTARHHDDPDLQLQPDDAAGRRPSV